MFLPTAEKPQPPATDRVQLDFNYNPSNTQQPSLLVREHSWITQSDIQERHQDKTQLAKGWVYGFMGIVT